MSYKYITNNNLYEKQTYMYSEYKGMDFIKEYINSRQTYISNWKHLKSVLYNKEETEGTTKQELKKALDKLQMGIYDKEIIKIVDVYTKSFEVRKRIYMYYDDNQKPLDGSGFEDYENYLLFANCLILVYRHTKCLKYYSCLLKIDDTLLSVQNKLEYQLRKYFSQLIKQELNIFYELMEENYIYLEEKI